MTLKIEIKVEVPKIVETVGGIVKNVTDPVKETLMPTPTPPKPVLDIVQRTCEKCGKPAVKVDRDRIGKRTCAEGHTWYPTRKDKIDG